MASGGQQQHDSQTYLERPEILQEVLVVRLEGGELIEERPRVDHCPYADHGELQPDRDGDHAYKRATSGILGVSDSC